MATITLEGRRVWVKTQYGEACAAALKSLGAKWDAGRKSWWLGSGKLEQVEKIIAAPAESHAEAAARETERQLERDRANILGRAALNGKSYYVVAHGGNERGDWVKLLFRDGSKSFFKTAAEVEITKTYQRPQTLTGLQAFAEQLKTEEDQNLPFVEDCWECGAQYRTYGNVDSDNMSCRRCG